MQLLPSVHPVLTCRQAAELERSLLKDSDAEWSAMKKAGKGIAEKVLEDFLEAYPLPDRLCIFALIGKGHNGGDALLACSEILARFPRAQVSLFFAFKLEELKPLAAKAYEVIEGRAEAYFVSPEADEAEVTRQIEKVQNGQGSIDLCIDGLLGMSFQPPLGGPIAALIQAVNRFKRITLRASVDLPSGLNEETVGTLLNTGSEELDEIELPEYLYADFSYATGAVKQPLFSGIDRSGRVRYIDLGFFDDDFRRDQGPGSYIVGPQVLKPRSGLREAVSDKRDYGHLFIIAGSRHMPGALLMAAKAAVQSGVGRVTAFAPVSASSVFAGILPEVMWFPMPESPNGFMSPRGMPYLLERLPEASTVLMGPGMGRDRNIDSMVCEVIEKSDAPVVLDADALSVKAIEFVGKRKVNTAPVIITPHMGEFLRMAKRRDQGVSDEELIQFCQSNKVTTVLKAAITRLCEGENVYYSPFGGPVLARGGSGDLLAGVIAGFLAQGAESISEAAAQGIVLHGLAAEAMARSVGQQLVKTSDILNYFHQVIR